MVKIDLALPEYSGGCAIKEDGEYFITGTYPEDRDPNIYAGGLKAVIYIASNVTATITLENVNISLTGEQCPFYASKAKDITLILKGDNNIIQRQFFQSLSLDPTI